MVKKKPQTEKKKPGIYKRILNWIVLFAISFLIILALIFQAPWKVKTLLLIILAARRCRFSSDYLGLLA